MKTFDELQQLWADSPKPPTDAGTVAAICVRKGDGVHDSVQSCELSVEEGLVGDRWKPAHDPDRDSQLTLINARVSELIGHAERAGYESGDNFVVDLDITEANLAVGARLRIGAALIEVTPEPHTGCSLFSSRFGADALKFINWKDNRGQRLRGLHAKVVEPGAVRVGDAVEILR